MRGGGLDSAPGLERRVITPRNYKFDGEKQAKIIATAYMEVPEWHARWPVRLPADRLIEMGGLDLGHDIPAQSKKRIPASSLILLDNTVYDERRIRGAH